MNIHFIKHPRYNFWYTKGVPGYRIVLGYEKKSKIALFEIERCIEGEDAGNDYYYKTIYYEELHLCEVVSKGFSPECLRNNFTREIKKIAERKIKEDMRNGRKV